MAKTSHTIDSRTGPLRRGRQRFRVTGRSTERSVQTVIVIGGSAGGHYALRQVIRELSKDIPAAIVILLHMSQSPSGTGQFALGEWLQTATHIPIVSAKSGERLRKGVICIVPPGMSARLKGGRFQVTPLERGKAAAVTINALFESAAREFSHRVIGVILTGMLQDGTEGLKAVHEAGGLTIVQDPSEAEYPDMPASAMRDLPVTFCLKLGDIGSTLDLLARRKSELETGLAISVRMVKERVAFLARLIAQSKSNPVTSEFLSIEMTALQRDLSLLETLVAKALVEDNSGYSSD